MGACLRDGHRANPARAGSLMEKFALRAVGWKRKTPV